MRIDVLTVLWHRAVCVTPHFLEGWSTRPYENKSNTEQDTPVRLLPVILEYISSA